MSLRRRALFFAGLFVAVSCSDAGNPLAPPTGPEPVPTPVDDAIQALKCTVGPSTSGMECVPYEPGAGGAQATQMITGGEDGEYVELASSLVSSGPTFREIDVTVQNLMLQALGVDSTGAAQENGVRIWFASDPPGAVTVDSMSGTAILMGAPTPYFQYDTVLLNGETSAPKRWRFDYPSDVAFDIYVYVVAHVQFPDGWVEIMPDPVPQLAPGETVDLNGTAWAPRAPAASAVHQTLKWTSDNPAVASVDEATGLVTANALGTATITATNDTPGNGSPVKQSGSVTVIVNSPVNAVDDAVDAVGNIPILYPASVGVLVNDTDADDATQDLEVTSTTVTTANGTTTFNPDGSFTYLSNAGFTGVDVVNYTVSDGVDEDQGTLTVTVGQRYWYVQPGAASNGDGRRNTPFNTLAAADAASSGTEPILVLGGGGAPAAGAGIVLNNGQHIIGQGISAHLTTTLVGGQVNLTLLQSTGVSPTIRANAGATVTLGQNNTIRGVIVESASGAAITGSNFGTLTASEMVTLSATGGPALNLTSGTLNNVTVLTLSSTNSTSTGLSLTQVGGSLTANGGTIQGSAGNAVTVAGDSATAITYAGNVRQKTAGMALLSVSGNHTGTLTFNVGALADSAGTGLQFSGADGTYNFNGATTLVGSTAGIGITGGSNGTFAFSASTLIEGNGLLVQDSEPNLTYPGTITTTSGRPVEVNGASPCGSITVSGNISSTASGILVQDCNAGTVSFTGAKTLNTGTNAALTLSNNTGTASVSLTGGALSITTSTGAGILGNGAGGFGSLTVSNATVNATNGPALSLTNGTLNATFGSLTSTNSATNGVTLTTVNGTLNTSGGSISGAAGTAFNVSGGNLAGTIATGISQATPSQALIAIAGGHNTGTLTFSGNVSATNGTGVQFTDADGTYTFTGNFNLDGAGDEGIDLGASSTGTVNVTPAGGNTAAITSPSGIAISIAGGSLNYSGNVTQASNAALLSVTGGAGGHTGTVTFPSGTLNADNGSGLQFDNADGTYDFDGTVLLDAGDAGIDVTNGSDGTFTFAGTTTITSPSTGNLISILNSVSPFSFTYSGGLTKANNNVTGILISNNTGGTVTFDGDATSADGDLADVARTIQSGSSAAVSLVSNSGMTINFNGGGLNILTTSGTGFNATGGGTVQVTGAGNQVNSNGGGTAVNVQNTTIGGSGMSFYRVDATGGGTNGIVLSNTGAGGFQVTGDGASDLTNTTRGRITARSGGGTIVLGSGGTISGKSGDAVSLNTTGAVILRNLTIQSNSGDGVQATSSSGVTIDNTRITGHTDNSSLFFTTVGAPVITHSEMENNAFGAGAPGSDIHNVRLISNTGTGNIQASVIANTSAGAERQLQIFSTTGTLSITVTNNRIGGSTVGDGVGVYAYGSSNITANFQNDSIHNNSSFGIDSGTQTTLSGTLNLTVNSTALRNNALGVAVAHGSSGTTTFSITNNNIQTNVAGSVMAININRLGSGSFNSFGLFTGTISGNTIGTAGTANSGSDTGSGIEVESNGSGGITRVAIVNNTIRQVATHGIYVAAVDANIGGTTAPLLEARVASNTISNMEAVGLDGIHVLPGALSTDDVTMCVDIANNNSTGIRNGLRVRPSGLPAAPATIQLEGWDGVTARSTYFSSRPNTLVGGTAAYAEGTPSAPGGFVAVANCNTP